MNVTPDRIWRPGDVISAKGTVKEHKTDPYADEEKTTVIQRLASVELLEEGPVT